MKIAPDYGIKPGDIFGRLKIIERVDDSISPRGQYKSEFLCECSCEKHTKFIANGHHLISQHTKSCGCYRAELSSQRRLKHNVTKSHIYNVYDDMIARCTNPNCAYYKNYGGRGITICPEWYDYSNLENIEVDKLRNFWNWAITHPTYREDYTLDRLDVNGPYSPENCVWSSNFEQINNRRCTEYVDFNGTMMSIGQLANILGIGYHTLYSKFAYQNFDINKVFVPYVLPNGYTVNTIINKTTKVPISINCIYYIDPYGRPISQKQYEEIISKMQPALWNMNKYGFIINPVL